jgi:acetyl-CoA synthetase
MTTHRVFNLKDDEVFWCTAALGRITGHSYGVYGPLLNGFTSVLFEGVHHYPDFDRTWEIVSKYRVNKFYTTPAVIRGLAEQDVINTKKHDISCLKILSYTGESMDSEVWHWFQHHVGKDRCPIIDTYWQSEAGGHLIASLPRVLSGEPQTCTLPFFGIDPVILDDTGEEVRYPNQRGVLCIRKPWPGMARTVYGDHEKFIDPYFSKVQGMYFTADDASKDEKGCYQILGRVDDVLIVSGHRLGALEIEASLSLHPLVNEAAVVGFPHPVKGQGIYAFVIPKEGQSGSDDIKKEIIQLVKNEIGPIASIDIVQWAEALPKTRSGKVVRHVLDKIASGKPEEVGDISMVTDPDLVGRLIRERMSLAECELM